MSRRATFRPNILTTHYRLVKDFNANVRRALAGRCVWNPGVRRAKEKADDAVRSREPSAEGN